MRRCSALDLGTPDRLSAELVKKQFILKGNEIYQLLVNKLTEEKRISIQKPPAGNFVRQAAFCVQIRMQMSPVQPSLISCGMGAAACSAALRSPARAGSCQRCWTPTALPGRPQNRPAGCGQGLRSAFSVPTMGLISVWMVAFIIWMEGAQASSRRRSSCPAARSGGLFQFQLTDRGHHDAIAGGFHLLKGAAHLLVLPFGLCQLHDAGHPGPLRRQWQGRSARSAPDRKFPASAPP